MIRHEKIPILYVDDTVAQRYAMRRILETEGFRVVEAGTGKEALKQVAPSVALAVVDVRLPDMSGYDLSRKLKAILPHLPILQVSASFSDPDLRAAGLSGGADAYIAQPVHPTEMTSLIRRMLRTAEVEERLRFLASVGPILSASLSVEETIQNIRNAVVPEFADECVILVEPITREPVSDQSVDESPESRFSELLQHQPADFGVTRLRPREMLAPLTSGGRRIGAILFKLNEQREYESSDQALAVDLASRAGLALQNCLLLALEQSTRSALVQSEKIATAGRMSAAIAHEINNPLEALTNLIFIIEQSPQVPNEMREVATSALAEVTRLAHITRQSLGFYKELSAPTLLNLSESIQDTVSLYEKRIRASKVEVVLKLESDVPVWAVKGEVRQVISNLLVNALEAMPDGGSITIGTKSEGLRASITIEDQGSGIDRAIQANIFEPFFTTKRGTGTGLGLWITKSIVEKHNGQISVVSDPQSSHGTTFIVELPRAV